MIKIDQWEASITWHPGDVELEALAPPRQLQAAKALSLEVHPEPIGEKYYYILECDWPMRGQYPGHVTSIDQWEASIQVTWPV